MDPYVEGIIFRLQQVYVDKDYRKQGVLRKLFQFVRNLAQWDARVKKMELGVHKDNQIALDVYQKLGMTNTDLEYYLNIFDFR